ncbi:MAG: protein translocase subunit SecDF [Verrucomicrobia bacterium]|nr:MAG: protein translocase subunit SecDF [Verrucomicrobiota bacterium]
MKRNNFWKWTLVVFIVAWAIWEIYPPTNRDLLEEFKSRAVNTDTNFAAIVTRAQQLEQQAPGRAFSSLQEVIGTNDIARYFPFINAAAETEPTLAILHRLQREALGKIKLGLDLQGGTSFLVEMDTNQLSQAEQRTRALSQAVEVLRKRVDRFGVAEPIIQPEGEKNILIQLPGLSEEEKDNAKRTIQRAAFLEFRLVHPQSGELLKQGLGAIGYTNMVERRKKPDGQAEIYHYLVKKTPERGLTGKYISNAGVIFDPASNQPEISFSFNSEGAQLFADITRENVGHLLAIVLDGELKSAPVIKGPILGGSGVIEGNFNVEEAFELANVLLNPLEAPVKIVEERGVDPSLGKDSIKSGIKAAVIGTTAVVVFMLAYYMLAGLIANVALMLNIIILLGVMCSIGTTLTLPGIAGVVLTIGMAVDANVLIYERIREELAAGKSLRGAVAAGYSKAFSTIFDSNLTTLISSVILIFLGTGPVKGFGVSLTIGVTASMFTALVVTRLIFDWLLEKNLIKSLNMLHIIRGAKMDFMRWAIPAFIASWALILIGNAYGLHRGKDALGPDFAGGDRLTLPYVESREVATDQLREVISKLGVGDATIQYQKDPGTGKKSLQLTTTFDTGARVEQALKEKFPETFKYERLKLDRVGPIVGRDIQKSAVISSLLAMFGILIYVAFRYEFSFAVGAVIAIIHDVLMTLGWFFLTGRELSAPIVAAILTIIGFSINDTIVIFDRIREDLKLSVRGTFKELMNHALNRTLSRTIITSGTVFLATLSLYMFGGGVINDFAFTFLVGIITGTYSSIYIASALVLWWHKGRRPTGGASLVVMDNAASAGASPPVKAA